MQVCSSQADWLLAYMIDKTTPFRSALWRQLRPSKEVQPIHLRSKGMDWGRWDYDSQQNQLKWLSNYQKKKNCPSIEGTHSSLASKPTNPSIFRSIVEKFLHFQTKQRILYKGWSTKDLKFESLITLDYDYSTSLQSRRNEYEDIKHQLKGVLDEVQIILPCWKLPWITERPSTLHVKLQNNWGI